MLKIEFTTSNNAFSEGDYETVRILREITNDIFDGFKSGIILDINGNKIGEWDYKNDSEMEKE